LFSRLLMKLPMHNQVESGFFLRKPGHPASFLLVSLPRRGRPYAHYPLISHV
jgi:hypothetical protein